MRVCLVLLGRLVRGGANVVGLELSDHFTILAERIPK